MSLNLTVSQNVTELNLTVTQDTNVITVKPVITIDATTDGGGDMYKSVYDTNGNGIVDNAEKVNGLTVETAVPSGAVFLTSNSVGVTELKDAFTKIIDLGNVSGTVDLDWSEAVKYKCNLTGDTTLTFSNYSDYEGIKTELLALTSNSETYTLTYPSGVDASRDLTDVDYSFPNTCFFTFFLQRATPTVYQSSVIVI